jgi:polyribonucleotide nucleotidyltransferase
MIRKIIDETSCEINVDDDGTVSIIGLNQDLVNEAVKRIEAITRSIKPGDSFEGTVRRIQQFGVFVEFLPGKEGLIHVSDLADGFVRNPADLVKMGQKIAVTVKEIDEMGRINLRPQVLFQSKDKGNQPRFDSQKHDRNIERNFTSRFGRGKR